MRTLKHRFQVNPVTANQMNDHFRGRAPSPSKLYREYQNEIRDELLGTEWPFDKDKVQVWAEFGISNVNKDLDNLFKPLLDTLQKTYEPFNDNKVYRLEGYKIKVPKGEEYIDMEITEFEQLPGSNPQESLRSVDRGGEQT